MRDDLDLEDYRRYLEEKLAAIRQAREEQRREGGPVELDQTRVGRLSRMDAMQQQAMAQASSRRIEQEVQRLHAALSRLQAGDYGICVKCEEEIPAGRLQVDPATPVCIDCARAAEGK